MCSAMFLGVRQRFIIVWRCGVLTGCWRELLSQVTFIFEELTKEVKVGRDRRAFVFDISEQKRNI